MFYHFITTFVSDALQPIFTVEEQTYSARTGQDVNISCAVSEPSKYLDIKTHLRFV